MSMTFIDAMDTSRFLRPVGDLSGTTVRCRVYWKEPGAKGADKPAVFGGYTVLPSRLFSSPQFESVDEIPRMPIDLRTGFLAVPTISAPRKEELPDAPGFEEEEDD